MNFGGIDTILFAKPGRQISLLWCDEDKMTPSGARQEQDQAPGQVQHKVNTDQEANGAKIEGIP
jgi:hypothetical protein